MTCFEIKELKKHNTETNIKLSNKALYRIGFVFFVSMVLIGQASADWTTDLANITTMFTSFTTWVTTMATIFMAWPFNLFVGIAIFGAFWNKVAGILKLKSGRRK